ncbi:hypothetical protein KUCAC02_020765 [Chaenocephalus aceratus]|uniref:Uncharacterized protein n=1 Tax=Chaenocephalus aceratus TaxID=36190 RepID=A0ACB9XET1_CHAAC|nr:hypothetical protein KUCAC02_020765 [Chaenocephalus aceratus]
MENTQNKVQRKPVRLIAAACNDMGIGKEGGMPWSLPSEFQSFLNRVTTVSRPGKFNMIVWGKTCWFSHPESTFPLPNTFHAVLSLTLDSPPDHAHFVCSDLEAAVRLAGSPPLADLIETIWIVGGVQVYKEALLHRWCDLVYLTKVMADFDCDVFFPEFDRELFKLQEGFPGVPTEIQEEKGVKYQFQVFKRETGNKV